MSNAARHAGLLVFCLACAMRVGWVSTQWIRGRHAPTFPDEQLHWSMAENLVTGGALVTDDGRYAARMPLYPLFLTCFAWLGEAGWLAARLAQALAGGLTALLVYRFAREALDERSALAAGLLTAFDPFAIAFSNLLLTEAIFMPLAVGLAYAGWRVAVRPAESARCVWAISGFGAAALLTRPSAVAWLPLLWVALLCLDPLKSRGARRLALYACVVALALLPWGLRNRAVIGSWALLSANGGITLYDAQGPQADGSSDQAGFVERMPEVAALPEAQRDRAYRDLAIEQMRRDPARIVRLAWVKFLRTWNPIPNAAAYRGGTIAMISAVWMILMYIGIVPGTWRARARGRFLLMAWLPIVCFTLLHCIFIGSMRYRVPLMPFVELLAAAALVRSATNHAGQANTGVN